MNFGGAFVMFGRFVVGVLGRAYSLMSSRKLRKDRHCSQDASMARAQVIASRIGNDVYPSGV